MEVWLSPKKLSKSPKIDMGISEIFLEEFRAVVVFCSCKEWQKLHQDISKGLNPIVLLGAKMAVATQCKE